ncbi:hypothetical protein [Mangrovicoccus ximenensis]|uniref:hypothetical protein n=1 Tax=Mangrovicoccus ximenensis TaxID=1911570 RepID=UPI000D3D0650|nr:hypothetical protein [Mangrovicoccus ximenensis]
MAARRDKGGAARILAAACALALLAAQVFPPPHVPKLLHVLSDHAAMIADHGHSHGLEEDIAWALHDHSHDQADHDHIQAVLPSRRGGTAPLEFSALWHAPALAHWTPPVFRLERPPRA